MSSLAATQSDSYYVPPSYYESGAYKRQTPNQYNNSLDHGGGGGGRASDSNSRRSRGHNQYLQRGVVRFELPYDGFCESCGAHVGRGTRFNARKTFSGRSYFSTKIWRFETTCRACGDARFVIETDPEHRRFAYVEGIKEQTKEPDDDGHDAAAASDGAERQVGDGDEHGVVVVNPMDRLDASATDQRRAMTERDEMEALLASNARTKERDADANAALRASFRASRQDRRRRAEETRERGLGNGVLLGPRLSASEAGYGAADREQRRTVVEAKVRRDDREKWRTIRSRSIFDSGGGSDGVTAVVVKGPTPSKIGKDRPVSGARRRSKRRRSSKDKKVSIDMTLLRTSPSLKDSEKLPSSTVKSSNGAKNRSNTGSIKKRKDGTHGTIESSPPKRIFSKTSVLELAGYSSESE